MPEPYLDVPLWGSEEDDDMQHAVAWCHELAKECLDMADQIAIAFDQHAEHWQPEMLTDIERVHRDLEQLMAAMRKANIMGAKDV